MTHVAYNRKIKDLCHLCGAELKADNRCNSHILPRFIWKEYMGASSSRQNMILIKAGDAKILKAYGITDNSILCCRCDDEILGRYENDFKEIWNKVFINNKLHPIEKEGKLIGWVKEIDGCEDIIKTKIFILCCLWRASISGLDDYPIKLSARRERSIKNELMQKNHKRLPYLYHMMCFKFQDEALDFAPPPHYAKKAPTKSNLCYVHLPQGYFFAVRPGIGESRGKMKAYEFGANKRYFFIGNCGQFEGSEAESRMFEKVLPNLQRMYNGDKNKIKTHLLQKYNDLSADDIDKVLQI